MNSHFIKLKMIFFKIGDKRMKKVLSILSAFAIVCTSTAFYSATNKISASAAEQTTDEFYDDFSSGTLDPDKWLVAYKNWGGKVTENGEKVDYNGGVIPQNVSVQNGKLVLTGNGKVSIKMVLNVQTEKEQVQQSQRKIIMHREVMR